MYVTSLFQIGLDGLPRQPLSPPRRVAPTTEHRRGPAAARPRPGRTGDTAPPPRQSAAGRRAHRLVAHSRNRDSARHSRRGAPGHVRCRDLAPRGGRPRPLRTLASDMDETAVRQSPGSPLGITGAAQHRQSPTKPAERVIILAQFLEDRGALDVGTCCLNAAQVAGCGLDLVSCLLPARPRSTRAEARLIRASATRLGCSRRVVRRAQRHADVTMASSISLSVMAATPSARSAVETTSQARSRGRGLQHGLAHGARPAGVECSGLQRLLGRREQVAHGVNLCPGQGCQGEYDAAESRGQRLLQILSSRRDIGEGDRRREAGDAKDLREHARKGPRRSYYNAEFVVALKHLGRVRDTLTECRIEVTEVRNAARPRPGARQARRRQGRPPTWSGEVLHGGEAQAQPA